MKVKIKKLEPSAVVPFKAHPDDAGFDLVATSKEFDEQGNVVYGTGLAFEIPVGFMGLLFPRSSNAKKDLFLTNSVGVVDSGYRGEVTFKFKPSLVFYEGQPTRVYSAHHQYEVGDKVGQLIIIPYPEVEFVITDKLSETERGAGGYGSSGK